MVMTFLILMTVGVSVGAVLGTVRRRRTPRRPAAQHQFCASRARAVLRREACVCLCVCVTVLFSRAPWFVLVWPSCRFARITRVLYLRFAVFV